MSVIIFDKVFVYVWGSGEHGWLGTGSDVNWYEN